MSNQTPPYPATLQRNFALNDNDHSDDETPFSSSSTTVIGHNDGNGEYKNGGSASPTLQNTRLHSVDLDLATLHPPTLNIDSFSRQAEEAVSRTGNKKNIVAWRDLPHKPQLAILTMARLSEPLVQTSLQSYMFYQLRSFDPSLPDSTIASQAGILQGSFTAAQFITAMIWGRLADSEIFGRKFVLLIGLTGTMISVLGYGFARSFWQAVIFRAAGGALNGNVGVMRTMISEIIKEKKYQSRAFLLLPMCFNIGVIIGPVLGGLLADPAGSYPSLFKGVRWFERNPYAPPNLLSAVFLIIASVGVWLGLEETLPSLRHKADLGIKCGRKLAELWRRLRGREGKTSHDYTPLVEDEQLLSETPPQEDILMSPVAPMTPNSPEKREAEIPRYTHRLSFRRIFTPNVISTLIAHGLLACHIGTFNSLWFVFLSTPVADPAHPTRHALPQKLPMIFTGGLGMPPLHVGTAMAILGTIGITMQLIVYPYVNSRLGTVRSWRIFLFCFPVTYMLVPFLSLVPSSTAPPHEKTGPRIWFALLGVLFIQVVGRTFALPASTILINNCSPHPSVLGTIHGIGQSVSSGMRTIGPFAGGALYGLGLSYGVVGLAWWTLSCVAVGCIVASFWVREGDGHEIWLEGDVDDEGGK